MLLRALVRYGRHEGESAPRIAYELFHNYRFRTGDVVRHSCDRPACCNPAHLFVGTLQDNVDDRVRRGRSAYGERNGRAKLTGDQVLAIYRDADPYSKIAARFGVEKTTVGDIKAGRNWAWLTGAGVPKLETDIPESTAARLRAFLSG